MRSCRARRGGSPSRWSRRSKPSSIPMEHARAMQPDRLVYMANQIGKFFEAQRADEVVPGNRQSHQEVLGPPDAQGDLRLCRCRRRRARPAGAGRRSFISRRRRKARATHRNELPRHVAPA